MFAWYFCVPVRNLLDYLEAGDSLREFLEDFPAVTRQQAVAALELAKQMLVAPCDISRNCKERELPSGGSWSDRTNRLAQDLLPLMPLVERTLNSIKPGDVVEVTA